MTELERERPRADPARPWEGPVLGAALALGLPLMAVQLWILTVALDLYLGGARAPLWPLAAASGAVFLGGRSSRGSGARSRAPARAASS